MNPAIVHLPIAAARKDCPLRFSISATVPTDVYAGSEVVSPQRYTHLTCMAPGTTGVFVGQAAGVFVGQAAADVWSAAAPGDAASEDVFVVWRWCVKPTPNDAQGGPMNEHELPA